MAKSMRSKWKKKMKKEKAVAEAPQKAIRLEKLNVKLGLAATRGLRDVPLQEPRKEFHFKHLGDLDATQRLTFAKFETNVHKGLRGYEGNADGTSGVSSVQATAPRSPKAAVQKPRRDVDDDVDIYAAAGGEKPKTLEGKYENAARGMASDFVPSMDQVVGKRARNANKVKLDAAAAAAAAHAAAGDDDDAAVAVPANTSHRLATAAEKKRTGSSKMAKGTATKKSPTPKWKK